jgi:hypothetical protein
LRSEQSTAGTPPDDEAGILEASLSRESPDGREPAKEPKYDRWAWPERLLWTLVGAELIQWAVRLYPSSTAYPRVAVVVVGAGAWGLGLIVACWLGDGALSTRRWGSLATWATVLVIPAVFLVWTVAQLHAAPAYGTDEIAFDQYAAQLALHGLNPYVHSMRPAFALFNVTPDGYTYRLNGTAVTELSYPALSFEPYLPFLALGWSTQLGVVVNAVAWAISIVLLFILLPRWMRPAALLIGSMTTYISYAVGGVTDMLYLPLLLGAAYEWNRFGRKTGLRRWLGPILLGLAMSVKQTPWIVLPFVIAALVAEGRGGGGWHKGLKDAGQYLLVALVAFAVPNLPYLAMSPSGWVNGVLTPVLGHAVPSGQGAIGLSLFLRWGGGSLTDYSVLTVIFLVGLFSVYAVTYPLARRLTWLVPSVVLFFNARSFASYLICLVPVALVGAVTSEPKPAVGAVELVSSNGSVNRGPVPWRRWPVVAGGSAAAVTLALLVALSAKPPLSLTVIDVTTTGQLATVEKLTVAVSNDSARALRPYFTLDEGGAVTSFWRASGGPPLLKAGAVAHYQLAAPNFPAQPSIAGGFQVLAFTSGPDTVSASGAYVLNRWHVSLVPDAVDSAVPIGSPVLVRAELENQLDRPVHAANVPVYLGQVIYNEQGLIYSEAVVNGSLPGATPVLAYTDSTGIATFTIVGTQVTPDPVYFEANLVEPTEFFPYGYSQILSVQFAAK